MTKSLLIIPFDGVRHESPTLGVGYLKAYAERYSSNMIVIHDENFLEHLNDALRMRINETKPDFVGISFPSSAVLRVRVIARLLKEKYPEIPLFAGGYHPTSEPELTLRLIPEIDFVVKGEGEHFVARLNANWKGLPNAAWLEDGFYKENVSETVREIDEIPFPDRRIYDHRYFLPRRGVIAGIFGKTATLLSSRGCPYSCNFCSGKIMHSKVRFHSTGFVLSEIEHILSAKGKMDYLYFLDTMFLSNWERVNNLCRELIKNGLSKRFKWAATVTADAVDDEKVSLMKEAGCFYLSFGFESNSTRALKILNKRATPKDNEKACEVCEKHGIYINSAFLFGIPGEEEEDLQQTIAFVKRYNIGFTGINIMKPLPGSPFYERFVKQGIILPSIEEWHKISSIYQMGRIFNDRLSSDQYSKYIEKFYNNVRLKSLCNNLRANWRKNLKYLFGSMGKWGRE
jgi:radical SAM superfamily enzyme YgiQ (UPF0313 family)